MSEHTPGPLQLIKVDKKFAVADKDDVSLLSIEYEDDTPFAVFYSEHDARLMAAAPELLEALGALVELCKKSCQSQGHSFSNFKECQIAESIIAKAKGEQQ